MEDTLESWSFMDPRFLGHGSPNEQPEEGPLAQTGFRAVPTPISVASLGKWAWEPGGSRSSPRGCGPRAASWSSPYSAEPPGEPPESCHLAPTPELLAPRPGTCLGVGHLKGPGWFQCAATVDSHLF